MAGLFRVHRCPFCPSKKGICAIDLDAVMALRCAGGFDLHANPARGDAQNVVVFDPDRVTQLGCDHLISGYLDIDLIEGGKRYGQHHRGSFSFGIDHPHLLKIDPDDELNGHLWCETVAREDYDLDTTCIFQPIHYFRSPQKNWTAQITGTMVVAAEPLVLIEALQRQYAESLE